MYHHLHTDILTNETHYFFCLLGPRFDRAVRLMAQALQKMFAVPFEPIYIYSAQPNRHFFRDNFVVINQQADRIEESSHDKVVYLQEYEDLNLEFVQSEFIRDLGNNLLGKQDKIFVYAFTSSFLDIQEPNWIILGPDPAVVKQYDNKVDQYQLFTDLDLPRNRASIFSSARTLEESIWYSLPCYVTASYASGGNESGFVYSPDMLHKILSGLRTPNKKDRFLVSEVFDCLMIAPNASGIVTGEDKTQVLAISDQILSGTRYLGNVYPSAVSPAIESKILEVMVKVGNRISRDGFRGFFGCDFLVNSQGHLVTVDLNPRRQGGYLCTVLPLRSMGVDLVAMELECAIKGSSSVQLDYSSIQYPRAWAHSKVKPYGAGQRIRLELIEDTIEHIFDSDIPQSYAATFYEPERMFLDGYIGYVVTTGYDRTEVLRELKRQTARLLSDSMYTVATSSAANAVAGKPVDMNSKDFRGADLRGIDLRDVYLRGANLLREADLREVDLSGKDLTGADLRGATLIGANLEGTDLSGANLEQARLSGVNLKRARLEQTKLNFAQLSGVNFEEAHLCKAELRRAILTGANLRRTNLAEAVLDEASLNEATIMDATLQGASLKGADLTQVNLKGANLAQACLQAAHLEGANLQTICLLGANLAHAHLAGANLSKANLRTACLTQAHLPGADLLSADLEEANLSGANLERARLSHANLRGAILTGANLVRADLAGANLSGADLTSANLSYADLNGADLTGTKLEGANLDQVRH